MTFSTVIVAGKSSAFLRTTAWTRHDEPTLSLGESLAASPEYHVASPETTSDVESSEMATVRVQALNARMSRRAGHTKKVLRRLRGFVIETGGVEAKVGFVENGATYEYYLPATHLEKAGISAENQPFEMDEFELTSEDGVAFGYEFRPLAKPSDAFWDSFELDPERERMRDLIFKNFRNVKA